MNIHKYSCKHHPVMRINNILLTHKFFQSKFASCSLIVSVQNVIPVQASTYSQSLSPLIDSRINNILLQIMSDINAALLQLIDIHHLL